VLCSDTIFRLRNAKATLEANLKRVNENADLFQYERTLTKSRPKFLRRKGLTLYEAGKKLLHMQTKVCSA
jgi:hypothetical protein